MSEESPIINTDAIEEEQMSEELSTNVALAREALSKGLEVISRQRADGWSHHKINEELTPIMLELENILKVGRGDFGFVKKFVSELKSLYSNPDTYNKRGKSIEVASQYLPNIRPYVEGFLNGVEILASNENKSASPEVNTALYRHMERTLDIIYALTAYQAQESDSFPGYKGQFSATDFSDKQIYTFDSAGHLQCLTYDGDDHNYKIVPDQELTTEERNSMVEKESDIRKEFNRRIDNILVRCRNLGLELKKTVSDSGLDPIKDVPQKLQSAYISNVQAVIAEVNEIIKQSPEKYFGTDFPEFLEITRIEEARQRLKGFMSAFEQYYQ